jgi:thioesterase domain-containing protein
VYEALGETFGVPVIEAYGMTEAAHQMTSNPLPPGGRKPGSVGVATHIEVAVRADDGQMLGVGEIGEIVIRGETVFSGYEANPEANTAAFADGWFRTGDEGSFDEDGYLFLRGRSKEIINRAGEGVARRGGERLLGTRHRAGSELCSTAQRLGEDVGAAVVLREGSRTTERELQEHAAEQLADFKVPSVVAVVDEIPTGATGKLQRIGLAERLGIGEVGHGASTASYVAPRTPFEEEIAQLWASTLDVDRVGVDDDFFSAALHLGAELIARIAQQYAGTADDDTHVGAHPGHLRRYSRRAWGRLIVPVQTSGSRPPLFIAHALYDEVFNIGVLKRTLGDDQPLYALRAVPGKLDYPSIEELAREYFREVQRLQPSGPYLFASVCSGSAIVAELARHARAGGHDVALAAVIDPRADIGTGVFRHYTQRTMEHARHGTVWFAVVRKLRHWRSHVAPGRYPDPELEIDPLGTALSSVRRRYRLRRLPGTFTVIATMDYWQSREDWEGLADRIEWYDVEAPHRTLFQQPNADIIGALLARVVDHALRDRR